MSRRTEPHVFQYHRHVPKFLDLLGEDVAPHLERVQFLDFCCAFCSKTEVTGCNSERIICVKFSIQSEKRCLVCYIERLLSRFSNRWNVRALSKIWQQHIRSLNCWSRPAMCARNDVWYTIHIHNYIYADRCPNCNLFTVCHAWCHQFCRLQWWSPAPCRLDVNCWDLCLEATELRRGLNFKL